MIIITVQNRFFYLIFLIFLLICQRAMRAEVFSLLFPAQKVCPARLTPSQGQRGGGGTSANGAG